MELDLMIIKASRKGSEEADLKRGRVKQWLNIDSCILSSGVMGL